MKNADLFAMLCQATEVNNPLPPEALHTDNPQFEQIQVREAENDELTAILESDHCPMEVKVHMSQASGFDTHVFQGGTTDKYGKVNIL